MKPRLVPYEMVQPGYEAVFTGRKATSREEVVREGSVFFPDARGNEVRKWSTWAFTQAGWNEWDDDIRLINSLQAKLGTLDETIRRISIHIGSLVICDSGFPVTVDELLRAIGRGQLDDPPLQNGCWMSNVLWQATAADPGHLESMRTIEAVLQAYQAGTDQAQLVARFPHAAGFIRRTYEWLGDRQALTEVQKLMIERLLIPFGLWSKMPIWETAYQGGTHPVLKEVLKDMNEKDGRGAQIDAEISRLGGKMEGGMPHKHGPCDCHHDTFRFVENWIHRIGTGEERIPTRKAGTERARIGQLLFGYSLALDKWLLGKPMQFLLLDLGHVDLGFDPRNEILRVYAGLGADRTPVKEWLVARLWHAVTYNWIFIDSDYRQPFGRAHQTLLERATRAGAGVREWIDSRQGRQAPE